MAISKYEKNHLSLQDGYVTILTLFEHLHHSTSKMHLSKLLWNVIHLIKTIRDINFICLSFPEFVECGDLCTLILEPYFVLKCNSLNKNIFERNLLNTRWWYVMKKVYQYLPSRFIETIVWRRSILPSFWNLL